MTTEDQSEIDDALEGLVVFQKYIVKRAADLFSSIDRDKPDDMTIIEVERLVRINEYISYISVEIIDGEGGRGKALALMVLSVLLMDIEVFVRTNPEGSVPDADFVAEYQKRTAHMRSFIDRRPARFYDEIVAKAFQDHVEAHGPWKDRPSRLARKLKPEIDRRALSDGGKALEQDTITRRLKVLMTPTQH